MWTRTADIRRSSFAGREAGATVRVVAARSKYLSTVTPSAGHPVGIAWPTSTFPTTGAPAVPVAAKRSRPAGPWTKERGLRPSEGRRSSCASSSVSAGWKPNETIPRSRWLRDGSSGASHASCVAIGACTTRGRAGGPAAAGGALLEGDGEGGVAAGRRDRDVQRLVEERHAIGGLALVKRHVRVEPAVERDQRAGGGGQDADGGDKEPV